MVELLLNNGSQSTSNRRVMAARLEAAVCGAAMHSRLKLLQFLLAPPARFLPGRPDAMGHHIVRQVLNRGLQAAVEGGHYRWGPAGQDPLYDRCSWESEQGRLGVVSFLLKQGGDPNYENGQLLLMAVQQQQDTVLQELLRAGANKIALALQLAVGSGHTSAVSLLLSAAKGPVDSTGAALLSAVSSGHKDIAAMLLQRGANAAAALHTAVRINNSIAVTIPVHP
jgi:hypothetical protein